MGRQTRSTLKPTACLSSLPTCLTFRKRSSRRMLVPAWNTSREWLSSTACWRWNWALLAVKKMALTTLMWTRPAFTPSQRRFTRSTRPSALLRAAAFGNVHGVYAPGNVELKPVILHNTQKFIAEEIKSEDPLPTLFVFHGGSGSSREDIRYAIEAGVIKMNIDTDTQWAYWDGIRSYEAKYHDYLQGQIGNPESETKPNKKYYDPRMSMRSAEESMAARLCEAAEDLNCINVL